MLGSDFPAQRDTSGRDLATMSGALDSDLFPEEVRNYVSRVRKILARLEIPCDLVNRPGRGYSLTFRNAD